MDICATLHDLIPFTQFKKREKHPWSSVTLLKVTLLHGCLCKASHIILKIALILSKI